MKILGLTLLAVVTIALMWAPLLWIVGELPWQRKKEEKPLLHEDDILRDPFK